MTMSRALAALLIVLASTAPAAAQTTIFDTPDVRQDRERWTEPAYYRNNTVGQLRGMAIGIDTGGRGGGQRATARLYGSEGTGKIGARLVPELLKRLPLLKKGEAFEIRD